MSASLAQPPAASFRKHHATATATETPTSSTGTSSSQFKHTALWNGIVSHLKATLVELNSRPNRLRKQQSRFVAASVGSMLAIKQNFMNNNNGASPKSTTADLLSSHLDLCFSGSQCVDIVFNYLTSEEQIKNFQNEVTREKVTKLCQMIMNSGVFEAMHRSANNRFHDTSLRFYRLKQPTVDAKPPDEAKLKTRSKSTSSYAPPAKMMAPLADFEDKENKDQTSKSSAAAFCKSRATPVVSSKYGKRRLAVMRRSNTTGTLTTQDIALAHGAGVDHLPVVSEFESVEAVKPAGHSIEEPPTTTMTSQETAGYNQIVRELILEKLLSITEMPIVEHFLIMDKQGHGDSDFSGRTGYDSPKKSMFSLKNKSVAPDENHNMAATGPSRYLAILSQSHDLMSTNRKEEWRKSAMEVLEFLDWERLWIQQLKERDELARYTGTPSFDKCVAIVLMSDMELYGLVKDFYVVKRNGFLPDSFTVLFDNILSFLRQSDYKKALEILNLGSLLLAKHVQAELKRLLKFLYLTANSVHAPRLNEHKPNNSVLLNHFASCLLQTKSIGFEDSRLILNFMLNNFNELFRLDKSIEEAAQRRRVYMQKYGQEEALLEKLFCKRISSKEFEENSKEETTKALVDLINHLIDDPKITLKQKKLKLKALQTIHPEVYEKYFSDVF